MNKSKDTIALKILIVLMVIIVFVVWAVIIVSKSPESASAGEGQNIPSTRSEQSGGIQQSGPGGYEGLANTGEKNRNLEMDLYVDSDNEQFTDFADAAERTENTIKQVQALLDLQAIVLGNSPQAFINDSLYKTGDKIDISDGNEKYECVIEKISELEVLINCSGNEISLKIANPDEVIENQ